MTEERRHTLGPWRVGTAGPNGCPTVGTEQGLMTAMVVHGKDHPTMANALLIAAAPELLEALKAAVEIIGHPDDPMTQLFEKVIAKAEGR